MTDRVQGQCNLKLGCDQNGKSFNTCDATNIIKSALKPTEGVTIGGRPNCTYWKGNGSSMCMVCMCAHVRVYTFQLVVVMGQIGMKVKLISLCVHRKC